MPLGSDKHLFGIFSEEGMKSVLSTYCVPDPAAAPHTQLLRWQVMGERSERGVSEATLSYLPRWWGVLGLF